MKFLAIVLSSSMLVACGGSGAGGSAASSPGLTSSTNSTDPASSSSNVPFPAGSSADPSSSGTAVSSPTAPAPSAPSPVIAALAKYEGVWRQECSDHMLLTKTFTATGGTTFSVVTQEEYFDNADCTGALVATGSYGQPDEAVQYTATLPNAYVLLMTGNTIISDVDPATSVFVVAPFTFTGSHVTSTYFGGTTFARIEYADGSHAIVERQAMNGQTTYGALLLLNSELLALVPSGDSTTSFQVNHRYVR